MPVIKTLVILFALAAPCAAQSGALVEVHFELRLPALLLDRQPTVEVWKQSATEILLDRWVQDLAQLDDFGLWQFASPQPEANAYWLLTAMVAPGGLDQAILTVTLQDLQRPRERREVLRLEEVLWGPIDIGAKSAAGIEELEHELASRLSCLMGYSRCESKDEDRVDFSAQERREEARSQRHRRLLEALRSVPVAQEIGWMTEVRVEPPNLLVPLRRIAPFRLSSFRLVCSEESDRGHLIVTSLGSRRDHPVLGASLVTVPKSFWQGSTCYEVRAASLETRLGPVDLRELPWEAVYLYEYLEPAQRLFRASPPCESGAGR